MGGEEGPGRQVTACLAALHNTGSGMKSQESQGSSGSMLPGRNKIHLVGIVISVTAEDSGSH